MGKLTRESARYTSMVTIPIVCVFVVFSIPIIDIVLNSAFRPGSQSMQILTIYTYVGTLMLPYYYLVLGTDRPWMVAKVYAASGILNIILNMLFIPRDGLLEGIGISGPSGAAMATLVSSGVMFAGMYFYARKITRTRLLEKRIILHILAGVLTGLLMMWAEGYIDPIRWYHLALLSASSLGVYLGALWIFGEFRGKELRFFLETVNPLRLARHVKDEVRPQSKK
jgi:O-antigen/teichoic acid export membrane protein